MNNNFSLPYTADTIPEWCEAGQVKLYMCDKKGYVQAQYFSVTDYDDRFKVMADVLELLKKKAAESKKTIDVKTVSPEQITIIIKDMDYTLHLYAGTCVMSVQQFEEYKKSETPQKLLSSI